MHAVVIGGGLAGLTAAFRLSSAGERVTLLESSPRLGGQVLGRRRQGFLVEDGAEGFPVRRDGIRELSRLLGLEHRLITQRVHRSLRLVDGRLEDLVPGEAATLLGIATGTGDAGTGLATFRGGMAELVEALAEQVRTYGRISTGWTVTRLSRYRAGWHIERENGPPMIADAVILTTPLPETESLLAPVIGSVSDLRGIRHSASVTISLAAPRDRIDHPLDATGFVGEPGSMFRACTFCSSKFEDRAPPGWVLIRLYFRPEHDALATPDDVWIGYARQQVADILGLKAGSWPAWVSRWQRVFPQFGDAYAERVARLRERIAGAGILLTLAGASTGAIGVEGAVTSGQTAAQKTLAAW